MDCVRTANITSPYGPRGRYRRGMLIPRERLSALQREVKRRADALRSYAEVGDLTRIVTELADTFDLDPQVVANILHADLGLIRPLDPLAFVRSGRTTSRELPIVQDDTFEPERSD